MGATQMVAYNTQTGQFLKKSAGGWTVTDEFLSASGLPQRELQLALVRAKKTYPGNWMIMRRQDAMKIRPLANESIFAEQQPPVVEKSSPKVSVLYGAERSDGSEEIFSLVTRLEAATSANRLKDLEAKVGEYDKKVSEIYHFFESHQLNACQGYKAYRLLRKVLLERRAVKNEMSVVQKFRSGKYPNANEIDLMTGRLWSADIEELFV